MRRLTLYLVGFLGCAAVATMLFTGVAHSATCEKWAGKVVSAQGVVEVKPAGETRWQAVKLNETYCPGVTNRTDRKSRADIALYHHPILRLVQNSTVTLGGLKDDKTSLVDMLRAISNQQSVCLICAPPNHPSSASPSISTQRPFHAGWSI